MTISALPAPRTEPLVGHLGRWGKEPLGLLREGAALGPVFRLRLWRPVVVGYQPDWNRLVLRDLDAFRSRGSFSGMTPYLAGGVVLADGLEHRQRRTKLNPHLHSRALGHLAAGLDAIVAQAVPTGSVDVLNWSARIVRAMLNHAFFAGRIDDALLKVFLAPLHRPLPFPLLPRRRLFRRVDRAIAAVLDDAPPGSLSAALADVDDNVEELRIALAAGYDTTAHALAWALWHLADQPAWTDPALRNDVIDETLRLYPSGWLGSRVTSRNVEVGDLTIPAGTLVLYSPYLTHRDPRMWSEPHRFDPTRFANGRPAWGYIPFAAGERTCLGAHLARLILHTVLDGLSRYRLSTVRGNPTPTAGLTLRPRGPLVVSVERRGWGA